MGEKDEADRRALATSEREQREREGDEMLTGGARLSARGSGARSWLGRIRPSRGGGGSFSFSFLFLILIPFFSFFYFCFFLFLFSFETKNIF
jgi:hypothetical protein